MAHEAYPVIIVGGGQAGLSVSYFLKQRGIGHLVLERDRIAHSWRTKRWDSFCLVTPNWQCQLPGFPYRGADPQGFMVKDQIVQYIEDFASSFQPPLIEGTEVRRLRPAPSGKGFLVETAQNVYAAEQVVIAVGGYHVPTIPRMAERLPADITQIHSAEYRNPQSLPDGDVLVVGTGQSGCQIAEDLHLIGRRVHLCVGSAPRVARRYRGKDVVEWLDQMGYYNIPVHEHPLKDGVRGRTNHYVTGRDGGRDIDLRKFAAEGMRLHGKLRDIADGSFIFNDDLKQNLDKADEVSESIKTSIDKFIEKSRIDAPTEPRYVPVWEPRKSVLELGVRQSGIRTVIWSAGYKSDFSWIEVPAFDGRGYPGHTRGVTTVPGLYFLGLPWLHTWGSGRFSGIARDAGHVADQIEARWNASSQRAGPAESAAALEDAAIGS